MFNYTVSSLEWQLKNDHDKTTNFFHKLLINNASVLAGGYVANLFINNIYNLQKLVYTDIDYFYFIDKHNPLLEEVKYDGYSYFHIKEILSTAKLLNYNIIFIDKHKFTVNHSVRIPYIVETFDINLSQISFYINKLYYTKDFENGVMSKLIYISNPNNSCAISTLFRLFKYYTNYKPYGFTIDNSRVIPVLKNKEYPLTIYKGSKYHSLLFRYTKLINQYFTVTNKDFSFELYLKSYI